MPKKNIVILTMRRNVIHSLPLIADSFVDEAMWSLQYCFQFRPTISNWPASAKNEPSLREDVDQSHERNVENMHTDLVIH